MTATPAPGRAGLSGFRAIGLRRVVVLFVLVFAAFALVWIVRLRPDYLQPTQLGTDVATYFAAGQRLLAGHDLYALVPGDRPLPIWPPYWTVPLVGPPTTAVIWAPLALLPPFVVMAGWWFFVLLTTAAVFTWTVIRGTTLVAILAACLSLSTIITALSGNVNGLLIGAFVVVWYLADKPATTRRDIAIGILIALATAVKIGPVVFGIWLLAIGRWRAAAATIAAGLVIAGVTLVAAGPGIVAEYLKVAADTANGGVTSLSVGGLLQALGLPNSVVAAAPLGVVALAGALAVLLRRHRRRAFSIVAVGATFAVPVIRFETLSMLLVALAPWMRRNDRGPGLAGATAIALTSDGFRLALEIAGLAVAAWVGGTITGTFDTARSSLFITNEGVAPVVVRVYFNDFDESFGYRVPAGSQAWAWTPLVGGVSGPVAVYDGACVLAWHTPIRPDGGTLIVPATGPARLTAPPAVGSPPPSQSYLEYTDLCASAGNPGR